MKAGRTIVLGGSTLVLYYMWTDESPFVLAFGFLLEIGKIRDGVRRQDSADDEKRIREDTRIPPPKEECVSKSGRASRYRAPEAMMHVVSLILIFSHLCLLCLL